MTEPVPRWFVAKARCRPCGYTWVAVFSDDTDEGWLECVDCGAYDSEVLRHYEPGTAQCEEQAGTEGWDVIWHIPTDE